MGSDWTQVCLAMEEFDQGYVVRGPAGFYGIFPTLETAELLKNRVKEKGVEIVKMVLAPRETNGETDDQHG